MRQGLKRTGHDQPMKPDTTTTETMFRAAPDPLRSLAISIWFIMAIPVMLSGCVAGWMFGAFMSGVEQGLKDWKNL